MQIPNKILTFPEKQNFQTFLFCFDFFSIYLFPKATCCLLAMWRDTAPIRMFLNTEIACVGSDFFWNIFDIYENVQRHNSNSNILEHGDRLRWKWFHLKYIFDIYENVQQRHKSNPDVLEHEYRLRWTWLYFSPLWKYLSESSKQITLALTSTMQRIYIHSTHFLVEGAIKTAYLTVLQLLLAIDRLNVMNSCHRTTQCNEWRCKWDLRNVLWASRSLLFPHSGVPHLHTQVTTQVLISPLAMCWCMC